MSKGSRRAAVRQAAIAPCALPAADSRRPLRGTGEGAPPTRRGAPTRKPAEIENHAAQDVLTARGYPQHPPNTSRPEEGTQPCLERHEKGPPKGPALQTRLRSVALTERSCALEVHRPQAAHPRLARAAKRHPWSSAPPAAAEAEPPAAATATTSQPSAASRAGSSRARSGVDVHILTSGDAVEARRAPGSG